jgi:menaquinone-specific isochorismate synthase
MTSTSPDAVPYPLVVRTVALDDLAHPGPTAVGARAGTDDVTGLLDLLPADAPLAWVRRGDGLVGWGEALRITVTGPDRFADAERAWHDVLAHAIVRDEVDLPGTGPVAFGSFAFDEDSAAGGVVVVPRVVVGRRAGRMWLTTIDSGATLRPAPTLADMVGTRTPVPSPGAVVYSDGAVPADRWPDIVGQGIAAIHAGELDKVVLARDVCARSTDPLDVRWPLRRLAQQYPSCWTFSVDGMLGATPELLVRSEKGLVTSRVLAGTIRRTGDENADVAHAAILAHSSKDLEEHEYAVASVAHALEPFCTSINVPDVPFVLHLPNVLHLASDVTAVPGRRRARRIRRRPPVEPRTRRGAAPDGRGLRDPHGCRSRAHRSDRGHGPRTVRRTGRLVRRGRRRRVGHRVAVGAGRPRRPSAHPAVRRVRRRRRVRPCCRARRVRGQARAHARRARVRLTPRNPRARAAHTGTASTRGCRPYL